GDTPAGGAADVEHRDAHEFTHGRHAQDAHFAGVAAAPEAVVFVELARFDVHLVAVLLGLCGRHAHHAGAETGTGDAGECGGAEEAAAGYASLFRVLAHFSTSLLLRVAV